MSSEDKCRKKRLAAGLGLLFVFAVQAFSANAATTTKPDADKGSGAKPLLKAIDPSQAKMDPLPKPPQAPSINPVGLGGIQGAPISADKAVTLPPNSWTPTYPAGSGYPPPTYVQPPIQNYAPPSGYPQQQPYQAGYGGQYQQYQVPSYPPQRMPAAPPGYPGYPGYAAPQQPYGYGQSTPAQYGGSPQYGGVYGAPPYGAAPPSQPPPGYPPNPYQETALPPGFVQPGGQINQQSPPQGNFPAGRARLGGGHPNLVPQGVPQQAGPSAPPGQFVQNPAFPTQGGYASPPGFSNPGYPPPQNYAPPQGAYQQPQMGGPSYPNPALIPEFGKPLPMDASNKGPAQIWTTNQPAPGNAPPDPDEARVTRLEKVAFGSTYPEHEVIDRVDHLEKEIFGQTSEGDLNSRLRRLELKLGGGGNSFGSPMKSSSKDSSTGAFPRSAPGHATADSGALATTPDSSSTQSQSESTSASSVKLRIPFDKGAGDYSDRITRFVNNTCARWTQFPVKVRLPEDINSDWRKLMEPAIEKWGRYVPLKTASQMESADIEVSFVNHLVPRVLGVSRLTVTSGRMKVYIYMLRPNYYPQLPEKILASAFLHEMGHAVGLFGHSDKQTDSMFVFESLGGGRLTQEKLGAISARDVNTLKLIYDSKPLPDDFSLSAPQEWSVVCGASS